MVKKILFMILLCIIMTDHSYSELNRKYKRKSVIGTKIKKFPFYVYSNKQHISYFAISGYLGDVQDVKLFKVKEPYTFVTCIKVNYTPTYGPQNHGWAGIFWQWPPNNWGDNEKGGYDINTAKFLYFYARGKTGDELVEFKVGGVKGTYGDSDEASTGTIALTKKWKLYMIDLRKKDLRNIIGGFAIMLQSHLNPGGVGVYLNDIYYSDKLKPEPKFFKDYLKTTTKKRKK